MSVWGTGVSNRRALAVALLVVGVVAGVPVVGHARPPCPITCDMARVPCDVRDDCLDAWEKDGDEFETCKAKVPTNPGRCQLTRDRLNECRFNLRLGRSACRKAFKTTLQGMFKGTKPKCVVRKKDANQACETCPTTSTTTTTTTTSTTATTAALTPLIFFPQGTGTTSTTAAPTTTTTTTTGPTTSTTAGPTTTTGPTATTTSTTTTTTTTVPPSETSNCQRRCVNKILDECFSDCWDDCEGDLTALGLCKQACRNAQCAQIETACTDFDLDEATAAKRKAAASYHRCCVAHDDCLEDLDPELECTATTRPSTTTTVTTSTTTTQSTTTTTIILGHAPLRSPIVS